MLTKHDKKGPELFMVTPELLQGLENLAGICRKTREFDFADLLIQAKTGCSKVMSITPEVNSLAGALRRQAIELNHMADYLEQLFPQSKTQEQAEGGK